MSSAPAAVAHYRRRVAASLERVWENVRDWEHLPWLHGESFRRIALEEEGDFGWRARIGLHGPNAREIRLELVIHGSRYVSRTLEGPGTGSEIWTTLAPAGEAETDVEVAFCVPGVAAERADAVGAAYVALYTRLWDEDEEMMIGRSRRLAERTSGAPRGELALGPLGALRERLPLSVELGGRPFRIVSVAGEMLAHSAVCPHRLGPLDASPDADGIVTCPWHGYRFDVRSGRRADCAASMRLAPAPELVVRTGGEVWLVARAG